MNKNPFYGIRALNRTLSGAVLMFSMCIVMLASCSENEAETAFDPSKPIVCKSFSPTGGPIATQVILEGENFGTDASKVKVFFNEKEAPVVGVNNDHMLVMTPRLPGENVVIKVVIDDKEACFDGYFDYEIRTNISTICGGDPSATENSCAATGDMCALSEAQFKSSFNNCIEIDSQKNIFFTLDEMTYVANADADRVKNIHTGSNFLQVSDVIYDKCNDRVYHVSSNISVNDYFWFDTNNDFVQTGKGDMQFDDDDFRLNGLGIVAARRTCAMNPSDGKFYWRSYGGYLVRFDPESGIGENVTPLLGGVGIGTTNGSAYGSVFREQEPNVMYFTNDELDCIFRLDLNTGRCSIFAGQNNLAGYLDGPLTTAQFNQPHQLCVDSKGDLYVADTGNHCIRKINMTTGYVSTLAGIPQTAGYENGTSEVAKFNSPLGLCVDKDDVFYVGDCDNHAIRRIAVE